MIKFCPNDGSMLAVAPDRGPEGDGGLHFYCASCPYAFPIVAELTSAAAVRARVEAAVVSGDGGWEQAQKSDDVTCPQCKHGQAYFHEVQTRSADEAATLFFRCVSCGHQWREA